MKKFMSLMGPAGTVVVSALIFAASPTHAKMVNCDKGQSIQAAVETAVDGGVVEVSGTCTEQVIVNNDGVEIVGIGGAIVDGPLDSFGTFRVRGRRVIIRGFTLRGEAGVRIEHGGSAEVRSNIIEDVTSTGITVTDGSHGDIRFNEVSGNGSFSGIFLFNGASAAIVGNTITNPTGSGIAITGGSSAAVSDNEIFDSLFGGIAVQETSYVHLQGGGPNTLENNAQGVACGFLSVIRVDVAQNFGVGTDANGVDGVQFNGCEIRNFVPVPFPLP